MIKRWSLQEVHDVLMHHEKHQIQLFQDVLKNVHSETPTMLELGAAEGYYSKMFHDYFANQQRKCRNICLELTQYKVHALCNNVPGAEVIHGYMGALDAKDADVINEQHHAEGPHQLPHCYTFEQLKKHNPWVHLDMVHVDMQGGEDALLDEWQQNPVLMQHVHYFFVSTHADIVPGVHEKCVKTLQHMNLLVNHAQGFDGWGYGDGLVVAENMQFAAVKPS